MVDKIRVKQVEIFQASESWKQDALRLGISISDIREVERQDSRVTKIDLQRYLTGAAVLAIGIISAWYSMGGRLPVR